MKKIIAILCTLFISVNICNSQKSDTTYFDKKSHFTTKENTFLYIISKQDINTDIVKVAAYNKNGKILSTGGFKSYDIKNMKGENTGPFNYYKNDRLESFELYEPSKYPEVLSSLSVILEKIPQQADSLFLEINYYKNGIIKSVGYRSTCCDLVGTWVYYSKNGKYMIVESYKNNVIDGLSTVYYLGKIIATGNYKNGKKDGEWYIYYADGTPLKTEFYLNGRKITIINQSNN
jgi:antitoxin component YwqK of YwqJK toxin-antitoxin module